MFRGFDLQSLRLASVLLALFFFGLILSNWRESQRQAAAVTATGPHEILDSGDLYPSEDSEGGPLALEKGQIDLNQASQEALTLLPMIGPSKAQAIIDDRNLNGPFVDAEDLARVPGIGEKTVERLKPYIVIPTGSSSEPEGRHPVPATGWGLNEQQANSQAPPSASSTGGSLAAELIDLNNAHSEDLQKLPGIGPAKATAILEYRNQHGPFKRIDDLVNISGIGPKTLEKLRPMITIGGAPGVAPAGISQSLHPVATAPPPLVRINHAGPQELATLSGVGESTAAKIIYERTRGRFQSMRDLTRRVKGLGPSFAEKNRRRVTFD